MLRFRFFHLAVFALVCGLGQLSAAYAQSVEAVPGEYLVKFKEPGGNAMRPAERRIAQAALGVQSVRRNESGSELVRTEAQRSFNHRYAKELLAEGRVQYIEPNYVVSILQTTTPSDPHFAKLWGLDNRGQTGGTADIDVDAAEAWELGAGGEEIVVGVVDTGVDYLHPDLHANMWRNPREIPGDGIDNDGNGIIDDVYGYSALSNNGDPMDLNGHGTHIAGTIGGVADNALGIAGVSPRVKIMALQFLNASGFGDTQKAIEAIEYAVQMKRSGVNLRVLNNSWGGNIYSHALAEAVELAASEGILFVAAAGNSAADNDEVPTYPASFETPNILAVAAIDHNGNLGSFSNYGLHSVHLAAPGVNILSTWPGHGYREMSGTSMAAPHVSGVAALVLQREPGLGLSGLRERLVSTVKVIPQLAGLTTAPGIVSALRASTNARSPLPAPPPKVRYEHRPATFDYEPLLGERISREDDGYTEVRLGFVFPFFGGNFSRVAVSTNGRVIPIFDSQPLPDAADYSNRPLPGISIYHDDLVASPFSGEEGGVWLRSEADRAVITWVAAGYVQRHWSDPEAEIRFQLHLHRSGEIFFHYEDVTTGDLRFDNGGSATVGMSPVPGTVGERLVLLHNSPNGDLVANGKALRLRPLQKRTSYDYDGDGLSDIAVWRPATGMWYVLTSSSNFDFSSHLNYQLGLPGDIPLSGDFDGDGTADLVIWRPSDGTWYLRRSLEGFEKIHAVQWGLPGDEPLVGDFDGDNISDFAVYRRQSGMFYALLSGGGFNRTGAFAGLAQSAMTIALGGIGNDPLKGDFDGDGKDDFVTIWQPERFWTVKNGDNSVQFSLPWGAAGDTPLACDLDGDSRSDRVVVRLTDDLTYHWFGARADGAVDVFSFGSIGDLPLCNRDFSGSGKGKPTVFRPSTAEWFIRSQDGNARVIQFGLPGDLIP